MKSTDVDNPSIVQAHETVTDFQSPESEFHSDSSIDYTKSFMQSEEDEENRSLATSSELNTSASNFSFRTLAKQENKNESEFPKEDSACSSKAKVRRPFPRTWQSVLFWVNVVSVITLVFTWLTYWVAIQKSDLTIQVFEIFVPIGLIALNISVCSFCLNPFSKASCWIQIFLPGLGLMAMFSGALSQLLHDLNRNVYIVNPDGNRICCLNQSVGLTIMCISFILGQSAVCVFWFLKYGADYLSPMCLQECARATVRLDMVSYSTSFPPMILGLLVGIVSLTSLKWRKGSRSTCNLLGVWFTFIVCAMYFSYNLWFENHNSRPLSAITYTLVSTIFAVCTFYVLVVRKVMSLKDNRELRLTANTTFIENRSLANFCHVPSTTTGSSVHPNFNVNTFSSTSSFALPNVIGKLNTFIPLFPQVPNSEVGVMTLLCMS